MKLNDSYGIFVNSKIKNPDDILYQLTPEKADLIHAALLLTDEVGELVSPIKKHVIYNQELDMDNVIEELGDIEFALAMIRNRLGIHREDVLEHNVNKLNIRYAQGYSDELAKLRLDKEDE